MKTGIRSLVLAIAAVALIAPAASAQLLPRFSVNGGLAVPLRDEADFYKSGFHAGVALKLPIIPVQFEASADRMSGESDLVDDLTILSVGAIMPIALTPALLPAGVYAIVGGGMYRVDAGTTSTDIGATAGLGARLKLPLFAPFVEARGVMIFSDPNQITYLTASVGIRL